MTPGNILRFRLWQRRFHITSTFHQTFAITACPRRESVSRRPIWTWFLRMSGAIGFKEFECSCVGVISPSWPSLKNILPELKTVLPNVRLRCDATSPLGEPKHREGPFGDHTGYYTLPEPYPVFHVTAILFYYTPLLYSTIIIYSGLYF